VCREEAAALLAPFAKWMTAGKPYLTLKIGMTLDGRIADAKRNSRWITCSAARRRVRSLRRTVDAILVGSGTVIHDNPSLRWSSSPGKNPLRVVADTRGAVPLDARILTDGYETSTVIATTQDCSEERRERYRELGATVWVLPKALGHVSVRALFGRLGRGGILHVLSEGGAYMAEALIRADMVDRYMFFVAPLVMGGTQSLPAVAGQGWPLAQARRLKFTGCEKVGDDVLITGVRSRG